MSNTYLAEIRIFGFDFAPIGWAFCNGQLLSISSNTALFSLLGTNYGGNGTSTFGLPNLQGSVPIHWGQGPDLTQRSLGEVGGEDFVTLLTNEMPVHTHNVQADADNDNATAASPSGAVFVNASPVLTFSNAASPQIGSMNPAMVAVAGGSQSHNNLMPYLTLNFCIALRGAYPQRS
jgi:microcystin-dependent protein